VAATGGGETCREKIVVSGSGGRWRKGKAAAAGELTERAVDSGGGFSGTASVGSLPASFSDFRKCP
jgi:hypothetical protein